MSPQLGSGAASHHGAAHEQATEPESDGSHGNAGQGQAARDKLVRAATRLIDDTQQWTWSIREICDEAQLPYNAFYRSFRHKHALVDALSASWRVKLQEQIKGHSPHETLVLHVQWLMQHRRRVRFLAAEVGVYQGCNVAIADLGALMPPRATVVAELMARGYPAQAAQRRALAGLVFLLGYLSAIDALRSIWAADCGFCVGPPSPRAATRLSVQEHIDELTWVLGNLGVVTVDDRQALPLHVLYT